MKSLGFYILILLLPVLKALAPIDVMLYPEIVSGIVNDKFDVLEVTVTLEMDTLLLLTVYVYVTLAFVSVWTY